MSDALRLILVRSFALGAGLAAYYWIVARSTDSGDANIGLGLLAFGLLMIASGAWGLVDGLRHPFSVVSVVWVAAAVVLAVGLVLALAITEADGSTSITDVLVADAGLVPLAVGLVVVPALLAGAVGRSRAASGPPAAGSGE